jgi:hypothetical protein
MVAPTEEEWRVLQKMLNEDPTPEELEIFKKYLERRRKAEGFLPKRSKDEPPMTDEEWEAFLKEFLTK